MEVELLKAIDHPNIVRCVDDGIDGQFRYIAMPRLPGWNLRIELQETHRLDPNRAANIARQIATALRVFHQLGAVHRDVKPENVQLDDASDHAWLLDAGYARYVKKTRITDPDGRPPGTEGYRAPETLHGYTYKQSDFYSLGVLLYEMLSGRHPFDHHDPERRHPVVPIQQLAPDCPKYLRYAVEFLLAWEVRNRPQTATDVLALLEDPARGLRVVARRQLRWASGASLPLLVKLSEKTIADVRRAADEGVRPDAYLVGAGNRATCAASGVAADANRDLVVDPELHQAAHTGFEFAPGFAAVVCSDHSNQPLTPDDLYDPQATRAVARLSLDVEAELGGTVKLVPGFLMRDTLPDGWLGCNSMLLDECVDALPREEPFAIRVLVSLEAAATAARRQRFADAIGRHNPDLFLVSYEGLSPNPSSEQLLRALELVQPLQRVAPCVICDGGSLASFWFSFGLGVCFDLFAEEPLSIRRHRSWASARFDFPSLLTSLRLEDAKLILERGEVLEAQCPCFACRSAESLDGRLKFASAHNAAMASRERAEAMSVPPTMRARALQQRVKAARIGEVRARVGRWELRVARLDQLAAAATGAEARLAVEAA